jgi:hypothetical protein
MIPQKISQILPATLLLAILASCGAGAVDVQTNGSVSGAAGVQLLSISIEPADPRIAQNTSQQFTATGIYSDNTTRDLTASVTWSSSDAGIATAEYAAPTSTDIAMLSQTAPKTTNGGKAYAYGKNAGTTTVTASSGSTSGSTTITVTNATLVSLAVIPTNPSIPVGTALQFIATGTFSDNTTQDLTTNNAIWSSSDAGVATISTSGLAASIATGSTTVTAAWGSVSGSTTLTVKTTGSATLAWNAPTTNTDGTPLTDLAGHKIYFGTSSGSYTTIMDVGNVTTYTINNLSSGTYYFTVTSYDSSGIESSYAGEVSKTI